MPHAKTARGAIRYLRANPAASGRPLLLIHGAGGNAMAWPESLRHLAGRPVYAVDLPGHGQSAGPGRQRVAEYAADLAALAETEGWPPLIVCGHSMGGAISQQLALAHPERTAALILVSTGARLKVNPSILEQCLSDTETVIARIQRWAWAPGSDEAQMALAEEQLRAVTPAVLRGDYLACHHFDIRGRLRQIQQPTLVCCGALDKMTPLSLSQQLVDEMPAAELREFAGAGHMLPLERPQAMAAALSEWLARRS